MPKLKNRCFNVDAILKNTTIDSTGKTYAFQQDADGFSVVKVENLPNVSIVQGKGTDYQSLITQWAFFTAQQTYGGIGAYAIANFPNITSVYIYQENTDLPLDIDDNAFIVNVNLEKIYVNENLLSAYQTKFAGKPFISLFDTYSDVDTWILPTNIGTDVAPTTITHEWVNRCIAELSSMYKPVIVKVVIPPYFTNVDSLWSYSWSQLVSVGSNVYYGGSKLYETLSIAGTGTLTSEMITALLTGNLYLTTIKDIKYSGFSNYDVALTYDYSALTSLEYVWEDDVRYNADEIKALNTPLCFTANTAGSTVSLTFNADRNTNTAYSLDNQTWNTYTSGTIITLTNIGDKVYFRNDITANSPTLQFIMTGSISSSGNVNSMYVSSNFNSLNTLTYNECYKNLFRNCASLTTSPLIPATTLSSSCYQTMFAFCSSLTKVSLLPTTNLSSNCYSNMFYDCSSLQVSDNSTEQATYKWQIPTNGTFTNTTTQPNTFADCLGTRASSDLVATSGTSKTYYTQNEPYGIYPTYFYPLSTFISQLGTHDNEVAYFDYTGTAPDMSAFTGWSYEWYDNASRTGNPVSMSAHKRYYLQLRPLNNSITILGSGTLTSGMVSASVNLVKNDTTVLEVKVPTTFSSYGNGALNGVDVLPNVNTLTLYQNLNINLQTLYPNGAGTTATGKIRTVNYYGTSTPSGTFTNMLQLEYINCNSLTSYNSGSDLFTMGQNNTPQIRSITVPQLTTINSFFFVWNRNAPNFTQLELPELTTNNKVWGYIGSNCVRVKTPKLTTLNAHDNWLIADGASKMKFYIETPNCVKREDLKICFSRTDYMVMFKAEYLENYKNGTVSGWSNIVDKLYGFLDYTDTIPTFTGYTPSWFSDEDCLTPISTSEFVSGNRYFVKLS